MNRFLYWLTGFLPCLLVRRDGKPYLERYFLLKLLGVTFYLHRFIASDPTRLFHDHTWDRGLSVRLAGVYYNTVLNDGGYQVMTVPSTVQVLDGGHLHRVDVIMTPCWTLLVHGKYVRDWRMVTDTAGKLVEQISKTSGRYDRWWKRAASGRFAARTPLT